MDPRSILSALMARGSGGGAPVGADEYQQLLAREQARYHGDRDAAVRSANIAGGFGNSTAQRFMHEQAAAPPDAMPTSHPDPMMTGAVPMPTPRPEPPQPSFPPDLPVSPMRPDNLTQMRDAARPRAPEPLPTDLAVSPMRPDNAVPPQPVPIPKPRPGGITITPEVIGSGIPTPRPKGKAKGKAKQYAVRR